jgi:hypothetical protein
MALLRRTVLRTIAIERGHFGIRVTSARAVPRDRILTPDVIDIVVSRVRHVSDVDQSNISIIGYGVVQDVVPGRPPLFRGIAPFANTIPYITAPSILLYSIVVFRVSSTVIPIAI